MPESLEPTVVGCMPLGNGVGGGGGEGRGRDVVGCGKLWHRDGYSMGAWAWAGATFAA